MRILTILPMFLLISCASSQPRELAVENAMQPQQAQTQNQPSALARFFKGFADGYNNHRANQPRTLNCYTPSGSNWTTCE